MTSSHLQLCDSHADITLPQTWTAPQIWLFELLAAFPEPLVVELRRRLEDRSVLRGAFIGAHAGPGCLLHCVSGGLIRDHDSLFAFFTSGPGGVVPRALPTAAALLRAWDDNALSFDLAIEVLEACLASRAALLAVTPPLRLRRCDRCACLRAPSAARPARV